MKSAEHLVSSIVTAMELVFGRGSMSDTDLQQRVASPATLSRATMRLDLMHMILKRQQWSGTFSSGMPVCISLCHWGFEQ